MLHPSDYSMLIPVFCTYARHFKSNCSCELFSEKEPPRKLIAGVFSTQGAVVDCFHYDVRTDPAGGPTVADHKRRVTEFADYTGSPV